jgi:hypothetical protein
VAPEPVPAPPPPVAPISVVNSSRFAASPLEVVETPPPESLGDDDLLDEIPSDMLESIPPGPVEAYGASADDDEPPISSQRPRALMALDDPLSDSETDDEDREVPLKTPPPESGPQAAPLPTGLAAPSSPDVEALLEADLLQSPAAPPLTGPTTEQLGHTIDLEEARGPSLELAAAPPTPAPPAPPEDLEIALPLREAAGRYDEELVPPPEARDELDAHLENQNQVAPSDLGAPESLSEEGDEQPVAAAPAVELIGRPPLESGTVIRAERAPAPIPRPNTFLELLDASITLGG